MRWPLAIICCVTAASCGGGGAGSRPDAAAPSDAASASDADGSAAAVDGATSSARGFPTGSPWLSFYGSAQQMGDLGRVASTFRVINIDADPGAGNFTPAQITQLRAGGQNRVISYFNLGSCENYRSYWSSAPAGLRSCSANTGAQRGAYDGYPDEVWMNVGDADYQRLLLEHVAPRLRAQGIDGFFFDNFEIVEHGTATSNGPCDAACAQGGLDLIRKLREKYPDLLFVMQNATGSLTRQGRTGGVAFASLLDGISHEEVYAPRLDTGAEAELVAWGSLALRPGGRPFWIASEDYVGSCDATAAARAAYDKSRARGFHPYATDASGGQLGVCYWPF